MGFRSFDLGAYLSDKVIVWTDGRSEPASMPSPKLDDVLHVRNTLPDHLV